MMTEKLKELNNQLNEKIDESDMKKNLNRGSSINNNLKNEADNIERKILEAQLLKIEIKAFLYVANNNFNTKLDIKTLKRLLRHMDKTHERKRTNENMIERVENLLESVVKKN